MQIAKIKLKDRNSNISYLHVRDNGNGAMYYTLINSHDIPLSLSYLVPDVGAFPAFVTPGVLDKVRAVLDKGYATILEFEDNAKLSKKGSADYAKVVWRPEDVRTLAPKLTIGECEEWLKANQGYITDSLIEHGWAVIEGLLQGDGIDTSDIEDQGEGA